MTNLSNFRELGGIPTINGKTIKKGLLFRGGPLAHLTDEDRDYILNSVKLTEIIDLRTDSEIESLPNDDLGIPVIQLNITGNKSEATADPNKFVQLEDPAVVRENMMAMYHNTVLSEESQKEFAQFFKELLNADGAIYFHCTAGKDRTGMCAALLLSALGVSVDNIMKDYLESNKNVDQILKKVALSFGSAFPEKINQEAVMKLLEVENDYIEAVFDAIESKYGSIDNYLHNVLNVSQEDRQLLISKYVD